MLYKGLCSVSDVHLEWFKSIFNAEKLLSWQNIAEKGKWHHLNIHLIGTKALKFKPFDFTHTKHSGSFVID